LSIAIIPAKIGVKKLDEITMLDRVKNGYRNSFYSN